MQGKFLCVIIVILSLLGILMSCQEIGDYLSKQFLYINATEHGVLPENPGLENSKALQKMIDELQWDETIYIPAGEYRFAEIGKGTIGAYCIKMDSNTHIIGDGKRTVLLPEGVSEYGLDMFYFNELLDSGTVTYLVNCVFEDFVIDGKGTSTKSYTSAGKGFMFNLIKECRWENVVVKNTDGTGFGVDCPIDCTILNCEAINCGKAATTNDHGASGFGIGFGYSEKETMNITNCISTGNRKFGFFFEHQGRFSPLYQAEKTMGFLVENCEAENNYYNFGGMVAMDVEYRGCISWTHIMQDYYFNRSSNCIVTSSENKNSTN